MNKENLKDRILRNPEEFKDYLQELIDDRRIDDEVAVGIGKRIISEGPEGLTDNQWYRFLNKGMTDYNYLEKCEWCSEEIPWSEMSAATHYPGDSNCSQCRYRLEEEEF